MIKKVLIAILIIIAIGAYIGIMIALLEDRHWGGFVMAIAAIFYLAVKMNQNEEQIGQIDEPEQKEKEE